MLYPVSERITPAAITLGAIDEPPSLAGRKILSFLAARAAFASGMLPLRLTFLRLVKLICILLDEIFLTPRDSIFLLNNEI